METLPSFTERPTSSVKTNNYSSNSNANSAINTPLMSNPSNGNIHRIDETTKMTQEIKELENQYKSSIYSFQENNHKGDANNLKKIVEIEDNKPIHRKESDDGTPNSTRTIQALRMENQ